MKHILMKHILMSYAATGIVCLCCITGVNETYAAEPNVKPAAAVKKLPVPNLRQWECRSVGPFGIRAIPWQPGMSLCTNDVLKVVNNSTTRIHAVYTNKVFSGDFTVKARFKGGSFVGLVKADKTKGLLGIQVVGSAPRTLEIIRNGSDVLLLLDGQQGSPRTYNVKKTDTFMFGVILNKKKACEIYGLECKTVARPIKSIPAAPGKIKKQKRLPAAF